MPLDPSIFLQGAQLKAQRDAQLSATLGGVAQNYITAKNKKAEGLDLDKLVQGVLVKKASGQELTPQDLAIGKAWDMQNSTKLAYDPAGNPRPASTSIFGGGGMPSGAISILPMSGESAPMPGSVQSEQLGGNEFPGVTQAPAGFNLGYLDGAALPVPQGVYPAPNGKAAALDFTGLPQPAAMQNAGGPLNVGMVGGFNTDALIPSIQGEVIPDNPNATQRSAESAVTANIALKQKQAENILKKQSLKDEPLNENQGKASLFADMSSEADKIFSDKDIEKSQKSLAQRNKSKVPLIGNFLVSEDYQKADQAERNFINAYLRRVSGAVISPEEFANARLQYIPQPGDKDGTLKQKAQNRKTVIEGLIKEAGPAYSPKKQGAGPLVTPSGVSYKVIE